MFTVAIILVVLAAGIAFALKDIPKDGYGTRPVPRSHIDPFEPRHHAL